MSRIDPAMVYLRDASCYNSIGVAIKYHWPSEKESLVSACGRSMLLEAADAEPESVPLPQRCRRSGCMQRWPKVTS